MSNFIYYEKLQDYEEQVRKAKEYDKLQQEIQRKDNVISELEKIIDSYGIDKEHNDNVVVRHILKEMLDKLNELRGEDK